MNETREEFTHEERIERVHDALDREAHGELRGLLDELHPAEVALVLESVPHRERGTVWQHIDPEAHAEVFTEAEDSVRAARLAELDAESLASLAQEVDADDAADLLQDLPEAMIENVLRALDAQERQRIELVLSYPEDTAGGLMDLDVVTVRPDVTLEVVMRYLRRRGEIPEKTNRIFVVDRDLRYLGTLRLADLLTSAPAALVSDVMGTDLVAIRADTPDGDVARLFEHRNFLTAPVVDDEGRLLGRITIDDVVDVIRWEGEHSVMSMAGLDEEEDLFAPVLIASRRRTVWLGVNLATALLASWVIGLFEATIQQVVALAVLMPVVASMGGIAGSQTLTLVIRGMALGQVGARNLGALLSREMLVGLLNSVLWAVVVAAVAVWWFDSVGLGAVVAAAIVINLLVAAVAGAVIPILLRRLRIDPAIAGGVILTTVTDVVGFMAFLGLGTVVLLGA